MKVQGGGSDDGWKIEVEDKWRKDGRSSATPIHVELSAHIRESVHGQTDIDQYTDRRTHLLEHL